MLGEVDSRPAVEEGVVDGAHGRVVAVPVEDRDGETGEHHARDGGQHAGEVAPGRAGEVDVLEVHGAVDDRHAGGEQRDRGTSDRPEGREDVGGAEAEQQRDQRAEHVLVERHARATVQERVVERVEERNGDRGAEDRRLARAAAGLPWVWAPRARRPAGEAWLRSWHERPSAGGAP